MAEPVVLSDDSPVSSPTPSFLTPEQRIRIAKQKELALARRCAKDLRHPAPLDSFSFYHSQQTPPLHRPVPSTFETLRNSQVKRKPPVSGTTHDDRNLGMPPLARFGLNKDHKGLASPPVEVIDLEDDAGVRGGDQLARSIFDGNSQCLDSQNLNVEARIGGQPDGVDGEWRSVRKRPSPGHSFGGEMFLDKEKSREASPIRAPFFKKIVNGRLHKKLSLSKQQQQIISAIAAGKSVFITGSAGTGKSYLLEYAVKTLKYRHGSNCVFVTASTGLAACAIGGTTLHSFSGIGLGIDDKKKLVTRVISKRDVKKRWMEVKALIIDEISMIDGELFDKLEYVARTVRGPAQTDKVFGGVQLVVTGDFFQLPPVSPQNADKYFAFEAECWNKCFDLQIELTEVFRQSDSEFVSMLNEIRTGECSSTTQAGLKGCDRPVKVSNEGILMTKLYPRKMDVAWDNEKSLRFLNKETVKFIAKDDSKSDFARQQLENIRAEKVLHLSVGAQVMLVKNVDTSVGLVNGARGVVVRFTSVEDESISEFKDLAKQLSPSGLWPVVLFACDGVERAVRPESWSVMDGNVEVAKRSQVPLILAWALSVHKCQGMTLDRVEIDLSRSFEYGMVYVALSRVKSLDGLRLIGFDASRIKVHSKVVQFYEELKSSKP